MHHATTSSLRATFKFRLFLGPPHMKMTAEEAQYTVQSWPGNVYNYLTWDYNKGVNMTKNLKRNINTSKTN